MGRMKISGPRNVHHVASCYGPVVDSTTHSHRQWMLGSDGYIYVEENGADDDSNLGIYPQVKTREMYLAGIGNEWKLDTIHVHHGASDTTPIAVWYEEAKTDKAPIVPNKQHTFTCERRGLSRIKPQVQAEGIALTFVGGADPGERFQLDYINMVSPTNLLEENSGK